MHEKINKEEEDKVYKKFFSDKVEPSAEKKKADLEEKKAQALVQKQKTEEEEAEEEERQKQLQINQYSKA